MSEAEGQIKQNRTKKKRPIPTDFVARRAKGEPISSLCLAYKATARTLTRWDEIKADEIERARGSLHQEAVGQLKSLVNLGVQTIRSVLTDDTCPSCNRPASTQKDRLKATEMVFDRAGVPKVTVQEITGTFQADPKADRRMVLEAAATVLGEEGHNDLAAQIRGLI